MLPAVPLLVAFGLAVLEADSVLMVAEVLVAPLVLLAATGTKGMNQSGRAAGKRTTLHIGLWHCLVDVLHQRGAGLSTKLPGFLRKAVAQGWLYQGGHRCMRRHQLVTDRS